MRRFLALGLALLASFSMACTAWAADMLPAEVVLRTNAHLRTEPDEASASQMILMKGQTVTVVDVADRWVVVQYGRFTGYIHGDLIEGENPEDNPQRGNEPLTISGGERPTLRKGARGDDVLDLQRCLYSLGYSDATPDGIFGDATRAAVIAFQKDNNIPADGIVGIKTYRAIEAVLELLASYGVRPPSVGP